jgi:hypothetical protein
MQDGRYYFRLDREKMVMEPIKFENFGDICKDDIVMYVDVDDSVTDNPMLSSTPLFKVNDVGTNEQGEKYLQSDRVTQFFVDL